MQKCIQIILAVLFTTLILSGCGGSQTEENVASVDSAVAMDTVKLSMNFYKRIDGTIANNDVVMHLQAFNGTLTGIYYYEKTGGWILLSGNLDSANINVFTLTESTFKDGENTGTLNCTFEDGKITGTWISADGGKNYLIDLKEHYPTGSYTFSTFTVNDVVKAFPSNEKSPEGNITNTFVLANQSNAFAKWINIKVIEALSVDSAYYNLDVISAVKKMNERYIADYNATVKEIDNANENDMPSFLNYESINQLSVCFNNNGYVILANNNYDYSGGAHGNGGISFYCLDVVNQQKLKIEDIIVTDSAILQPIVERTFRKAEGLRPTDSLNTILFENYLATTNNFYFTNKGIGFYYYPYEVAAYAVGSIHVFVPFVEVRQYLKPKFVQRMGMQ